MEKMFLQVSESQSMVCVGIDFGTTNSLVSYHCKITNKIEFIKFDQNLMLKTIAQFDGVCVESIKRLISNPEAHNLDLETKSEDNMLYVRVNKEWISVIDVCAKIFTHLRHQTNRQLRQNVRNCVITVPARFDEYQKQIILQSAVQAGWRVVRVLAEPTAGFIGQEESEDGIYGVYDLGGGTFDFSLIKKHGEVLQVIGTVGDTTIGMDYIDNQLATEYEILREHNLDDMELNKFASVCHFITYLRESGKIQDLSKCDQLIQLTIDKCVELMKQKQCKPKKIFAIGGGAMNAYIIRKLESIGIEECVVSKEPQLAVARGAALYASWLTQSNVYLLIDVAPLSIGVETMHGMVEWVIQRNVPLPIMKKIVFTNTDAEQTHIIFNIIQGEGIFAKDCRSLGNFQIAIPKQKPNTIQVELNFSLDTNGLLQIKCNDFEILFNSGEGLSKDMIDHIINQNINNALVSERNRQFYKICDEIDSALKHFPEEHDLHTKRSCVSSLEEAEALREEVENKLAPALNEQLKEVLSELVKYS